MIKRDSARAGVKDNYSGFPPASTSKCFLGYRVGARNTDDPISGVETCAAAVTRAQAGKDVTIKLLVAKDVTAQNSFTKNEVTKLQQEDTTLEK